MSDKAWLKRSASAAPHRLAIKQSTNDRQNLPATPSRPHDASPQSILLLQQMHGNRAVQRLLSGQTEPGAGPAQARRQSKENPDASQEAKAHSVTGDFEAGAEIEAQLAARKGSGQPLPDATRSQMEAKFGADFANVRLHTDGEANRLNRQLSAQAFTHGADIYFDSTKYAPQSRAGQKLLAHELTHVVQQSGASQSGNKASTKSHLGANRVRPAGAAPRLRRQPAIQRYTLVDSEDYQRVTYIDPDGKTKEEKAEEHAQMKGEMFREQHFFSKNVKGKKKNTYRRNFKMGHYDKKPNLRVADDGNLALAEQGFPKVFYANPALIDASNAKLAGIDSKIRLNKNSAKQLEVPVPNSKKKRTKELVMVEPSVVGDKTPVEDLMLAVDECHLVANEVAQIGSLTSQVVFQGPKDARPQATFLRYNDSLEPTKPGTLRVSSVVGDPTQHPSARDLVEHMERAPGPEAPQTDLDRDKQALDKLRKKFKKALNKDLITEAGLKYLAAPETPASAVQEVEERLRGKKKELPVKLTGIDVYHIVKRHQAFVGVMNYGRMRKPEHAKTFSERSQALGVNQYARPEVGEAFAVFENTVEELGDEDTGRRVNVDFGKETETDALILEKELALKKFAGGVHQIATRELKNLKSNSWGWHMAGVVARSGEDAVTLENYNRTTVAKRMKNALWEDIAKDYKNFLKNDNVKGKVGQAKTPSARIKALQDEAKRVIALDEEARQKYGKVKKLDVQENISDTEGPGKHLSRKLWYFDIYGPVKKSGDQTFYDRWASGDVNPIVLRLTGDADPDFKKTMLKKLDEHLSPKTLKESAPKLYKQLEMATTKVEVAEVYQEVMAG